jgi:hypothetical protein
VKICKTAGMAYLYIEPKWLRYDGDCNDHDNDENCDKDDDGPVMTMMVPTMFLMIK